MPSKAKTPAASESKKKTPADVKGEAAASAKKAASAPPPKKAAEPKKAAKPAKEAKAKKEPAPKPTSSGTVGGPGTPAAIAGKPTHGMNAPRNPFQAAQSAPRNRPPKK